MHFEIIPWVNIPAQIAQQVFVAVTLVYMLYRYRRDALSVVLLLLCFPRVFAFFGAGAHNIYKVAMLLLCVYIFAQHHAYKVYRRKDGWIVAAFVVFSLEYMWTALFYTQNTLTIVFSQYARYVEAMLLYWVVKNAVYRRGQKEQLLRLFYEIGLAQIVISVFKFAVFRSQLEGLVGSFSIAGGAVGTTIPILWFIVLWLYRKGQFSKWDWMYLLGLLFVGFTTGKRAVMFILPMVVFVFFVYVQGRKVGKYVVYALALVPLLFYLGVRLTPSLNPDNEVWGRFDWDYAFDYAETYQFGKEGMQGQAADFQKDQLQYAGGAISSQNKQIKAEGRGGATIAMFKLFLGLHPSTERDWWGLGFNNMYSLDYAHFEKNPLTIQLNHKGSATGFFQSYVATGLWGAICTVLFGFVFWFYIRNRRLRWTILGICAWEYFMYTGMIFRTPAFMVVLFLVLHYTNYEMMCKKRNRQREVRP